MINRQVVLHKTFDEVLSCFMIKEQFTPLIRVKMKQ